MNYYLVQTTYFVMFIVFAVAAYIVAPVIHSSFADASDSYAENQIKRIQGEMFFANESRGSFQHACYTGSIGLLVQDLVNEYGRKVVCKTNADHSQMIVYAELREGGFYCVDSRGVSCNTSIEPIKGFSCKEF